MSSPEQSLRNQINWNDEQAQRFADRADKFREELAIVLAARVAEQEADRARPRTRARRSEASVSSAGD